MATQMVFNSGMTPEEEHAHVHKNGKTPKYVVCCEKLFSSEIKGLEDCAPCEWVKTGGSRLTSFDASGKLSGDTRITGKDPIISMKYGSWGPILQQHMYEGTKLDTIGIYRLTDINGEIIITQKLHYKTCLIKTYDQDADKIEFSFCYVSLEDLHIAYDHEGRKLGQNGMQFDFTTLKVKTV